MWSWVLSALGCTALLLAGSGRRSGWALGLASQAAWVSYALATRQYGFILASVAYGSVYARNLAKAGR